ncbi:hypothetical protein V8C42DRAFT_318834 [Trichoderma barbatum]
MDDELILDWMNYFEAAFDLMPFNFPKIAAPGLRKPAAPTTARKRKAILSYSLASPSLSYIESGDDNNMITTPNKRR